MSQVKSLVTVQFNYCPVQEVEEVKLAGTFTDWETISMKQPSDLSGCWTRFVEVSPGEHEYKYFIPNLKNRWAYARGWAHNDESSVQQWRHDPGQPTCQDNFGGLNNTINILGLSQSKISYVNGVIISPSSLKSPPLSREKSLVSLQGSLLSSIYHHSSRELSVSRDASLPPAPALSRYPFENENEDVHEDDSCRNPFEEVQEDDKKEGSRSNASPQYGVIGEDNDRSRRDSSYAVFNDHYGEHGEKE